MKINLMTVINIKNPDYLYVLLTIDCRIDSESACKLNEIDHLRKTTYILRYDSNYNCLISLLQRVAFPFPNIFFHSFHKSLLIHRLVIYCAFLILLPDMTIKVNI